MPTKPLFWDELEIGQVLGDYVPGWSQSHPDEYRRIVDPSNGIYTGGEAPSLALNTLHAVKALVELPLGTVHAKETVSFLAPAGTGEQRIRLTVADKQVRRGKRHLVLEYEAHTGDTHVLSAYKSFVLPGQSEAPGNPRQPIATDLGLFDSLSSTEQASRGVTLSAHSVDITQDLLNDFGLATATDGPVHTDPSVARELFGGTILQGMYLFELAAQAMARLSTPHRWASGGRLSAKFIGSTITGEQITVTPTIHQVAYDAPPIARCTLEARNRNNELVFVAAAEAPLESVQIITGRES